MVFGRDLEIAPTMVFGRDLGIDPTRVFVGIGRSLLQV